MSAKDHVLDDRRWHPVVPAGEVWGISASNNLPAMLHIGNLAVKNPFHRIRHFEETDCTTIEFHRYHGSWNCDGFDKTFEGEVATDMRLIPVTVWLTELGFAMKAIQKPDDAGFAEIQLSLWRASR